MVIFVVLQITFLKYSSFQTTIIIFVGLVTLLILLFLILPSHNKEFGFFALAIVPASLYFFLGIELGIRFNAVIIVYLFAITLNASLQLVPSIFSADLLLEITIAYILISYFYYHLEKERRNYEQQLGKIIKEKNVLLREIHHRAKNNLQTIMGLLESQAMRAEDKVCKRLLRAQRYRLQSMSLLHQNLSHETNYEQVNMSEYLTQIVQNLQKTTDHILEVKIENFRLDMSKAINLGLLVNEAVFNAIKHAYLENSVGRIEVNLSREAKHCQLSIKDFGKGFDPEIRYNSLGLVLMKDIIHFFPKGNLMFDFEQGTEVRVTFSL